MEAAMDASRSNFETDTPPVEQPQEAEIRGGGEAADYEVLASKAHKLMDMITFSPENPNPTALHALASVLEAQESRYMEETGHISPINARSSHNVGQLANLVRENDDFFELISSNFLSEARYSVAVQAAALRVLLSCSLTWTYPHVFEGDVLENIKNWVLDASDSLACSNNRWKLESGKNKCSDFEMRMTYSTGLLAVCLTGAGQLLEDVLSSSLSAQLMNYLRIRVLGGANAGRNSHATEIITVNAVGSRGRDEGRSRIRQSLDAGPFSESRLLENAMLDQYVGRSHERSAERQVHGEEPWLDGDPRDGMAPVADDSYTDTDIEGLEHIKDVHEVKLKILDKSFPGRSTHGMDADDNVRDDLLRRKVSRGFPRSREKARVCEAVLGTEQPLESPGSGSLSGQSLSNTDRSMVNNLDENIAADAKILTQKGCAVEEDKRACFQEYKVGGRDISALIRSAVEAAEGEATAANAPAEAIKAAGDAAAELVKTAAVDELKAKEDEDAAFLAASTAASTVIDAAVAIQVSRNLGADVDDVPKSSGAEMETVEDIVDVIIPKFDFLAQEREKFCIRCLVILGEYIEVLGPVLQEKGVDVCIALLQRYSNLKESEAVILLPDVLKLICALAAHKKFATLFVDRGGMQKLLRVPRVSHTFFGLSSCLFTIGSLQGVMEHVCTLSSNVVREVVGLGLQLFGCSEDQARKNASLFFASVFVFRAILDAFDALDGLGKLLGLLNEAASVRINSGTSVSGSLRNDRSNPEVLTSSEKQIAYHTCVALRQYFRGQLLLLVDSIRPNKSNRGARSIPSVRAAHKPLDISNEAMDAVLLQVQKDRKLGPAFVRARWPAVDKFLACNGHVTMLELCQAPPVERYLHDLLQHALGVLQIVTLVPYSRKLVITATLSNNRVGIAIILDAASGPGPPGYSDPEIIKQALNVLVNLVCPPPSISNKSSHLAQGQQSAAQNCNASSAETRGRKPEEEAVSVPCQGEPRERAGEGVQTPVSPAASGLVGDRRVSLGVGAKCAGLAAQLEQGYCQARDAVRSNSGIKVLLQLIQARILTPPVMIDCVRALACRVLLGLARDEAIAHILTKLQVGRKLSELIRDLSSRVPGSEQSRWQTELTQVSLELISIVTNSGRASTLAATDAAIPTLRRIERAAIAASTPITYHSRELLLLIHEHLQACGLNSSAAALLKEAQLTPLPSLSTSSNLAHHVHAQDSPCFQTQWPSGRVHGGFLSNRSTSMARRDSFKIKPLVFSSSLGALRSQDLPDELQTPSLEVVSTGTVECPSLGSDKSTVDAQTQTKKSIADAENQSKTQVTLPLKRKLIELKEISTPSLKRSNTSDQGFRSPCLHAPDSASGGSFVPDMLSTSSPKDFCAQRNITLQVDRVDDAAQHFEAHSTSQQQGSSSDIQSGVSERLTLDSIVVQYLKHQHRQCPAPITTLPALSLLHPHMCPEPKRSPDAPLNVTARLCTREYKNLYGGTHGNRRDRQFIYSRYRPWRTCRDDASSLLTSMDFLEDSWLAAGFHSGEVKIFDTCNNTVVETCLSHQAPVTLVQSYISQGTQLVLSSSSHDVRLWDPSSISGGPIHLFDECKSARFGNTGTVFAALPIDSAQKEILLYDIRTYQLDQKLTDPSPSTSGRAHTFSSVHFSPSDTMLLWNGVLWDPRASGPVHRFDQFTDYGGGGFHPAGNEVIINSEVWDLRKLRLLRSVPPLDQTTIKFNSRGDVIYAVLRRNTDDTMSAVNPRRVKHPLFSAFRSLDAINYTDIATVPVDRCVLDFAVEASDSLIGLVTLDDPVEMLSSARVYEIGRRRPTDDDSDPDDADESDEEDDDSDEDDVDGDAMFGPILEVDNDGDADEMADFMLDDDDGGDGTLEIVAEEDEDEDEDESEDGMVELGSSDEDYDDEELMGDDDGM